MIFDELEVLYNEIDTYYSIKEFDARSAGRDAEEFEAMINRSHNDHAYYLYIFTRFERRIQVLFDNLIETKLLSAIDAKETFAWGLVKKKRLSLMEKVSFFTPTGQTDYNLIRDFKDQRDTIAHGRYSASINIRATLIDMKRLYTDLDN